MSRKSQTAKAVVLVSALTAAGFTVAPAQAADSTNMTITKVSPAKVALKVESPITITGKGFNSTIDKVQFGSDADCASTKIVVASATTVNVTAPTHADCVSGVQAVVKLFSGADSLAATFTGTSANSVNFVAPVKATGVKNGTAAASATNKGDGLVTGGTVVNVLHETVSPVTLPLKATIGGKTVPVKRVDDTHFTTTVPAGTPGDADIVLTANGVSGAAYSGFTYKQNVKVQPASGLKGATTDVVLTGVGFKPATASEAFVFFCGKYAGAVSNTTAKPYGDKKLFVTAPSAAGVEAAFTTAADATVTSAAGGTCPVKVVVDPSGDSSISGNTITDGAAADDFTSVFTKDSTFTYAAY